MKTKKNTIKIKNIRRKNKKFRIRYRRKSKIKN